MSSIDQMIPSPSPDRTFPSPSSDQTLPPAAIDQTVPPAALKITSITVRTGRLVCEVAIPDERFRRTTPRLAAFVAGQYPDLPHHACVNEAGSSFGDVIEATSVPHLLEHLVISEQVRNDQGAATSTTFVGTTEWVDEAAGIARVELGFRDDLDALRALNDATRFLNMALITCCGKKR